MYRVELTFNDDYRPKVAGFRTISLTVVAADQMSALRAAYDAIACLELPEAKSFSATRVNNAD